MTLLYRTLQSTLEYNMVPNLAHAADSCRQQLFIQNCGQTAADRGMVTVDSALELVIAVSNIDDPL